MSRGADAGTQGPGPRASSMFARLQWGGVAKGTAQDAAGKTGCGCGWTARGKRPGFNLWQAVDVNGFRAKATPPRAQDWSGNLNPDASKGARRWGPWTVVCW